MILDVDSGYSVHVMQSIDRASYEVTETGDGVGYRFVLDDEATARLTNLVGQALDAADAVGHYRDVTVRPGYIEATGEPSHDEGLTGEAILGAIRRAVDVYNSQQATPDPGGRGYLDALELGQRAYVAARPTGDPEAWLERHVGVERPPDVDIPAGGEPCYSWGRADRPSGQADVERDITYRFVNPYAREFWSPETFRRDDGAAVPFTFDEHTRDSLDQVLDRFLSAAQTRVELWPDRLEVRVASGSLNEPPESILYRVIAAVRRVNNYRGQVSVYEDRELPKAPRQPLRFTRRALVTVPADVPDRAEEWIAEHGLADPELDAVATGLEAEVEELVDQIEAAEADDAVEEPDAVGGGTMTRRLRSIFGGGG